jgi:hypothetical protein
MVALINNNTTSPIFTIQQKPHENLRQREHYVRET